MNNKERQRLKREKLAEAEGKTIRPYRPISRSPEEKRQLKLDRRRRYREKCAQISGREYVPIKRNRMDSHVDVWRSYCSEIRIAKASLCDAHVRRFKSAMRSRSNYSKRYLENRTEEISRQSRYKLSLPRPYVIRNLIATGVDRSEVSDVMVELKREQMILRRLSLELKQAAKKINKEIYESITNNA